MPPMRYAALLLLLGCSSPPPDHLPLIGSGQPHDAGAEALSSVPPDYKTGSDHCGLPPGYDWILGYVLPCGTSDAAVTCGTGGIAQMRVDNGAHYRVAECVLDGVHVVLDCAECP
jgi:hypothetical protein